MAMKNAIKQIGPGIVLAAAGIGASDFFGAIWAGAGAGTQILWAVFFGALLKYYLTEGLARYQMTTGKSVVHAWMSGPYRIFSYLLLAYFCFWSLCVSSLLLSACGTAAQLLFPALLKSADANRILYGAAQGLLAVLVVSLPGYEKFEKLVRIVIICMFAAILYCVIRVATESFIVEAPGLPPDSGGSVIALMTGVGGSLTMLSYGYWIREKKMTDLKSMRLDCASAYVIAALFGFLMVFLAANTLKVRGISVESENAARSVFATMGGLISQSHSGFIIFARGFWCVVTGSLLGVWQSVPEIFLEFTADMKQIPSHGRVTLIYRLIMVAAGSIMLMYRIQFVFALYAFVSSFFIPILAGTLLFLNNRLQENRNHWFANAMLVTGFCLYLGLAAYEIGW